MLLMNLNVKLHGRVTLSVPGPDPDRPPWRNRLARSAVNRKVGGSSPPGGDIFFVLPTFVRIRNKKNLTLAGFEPAIP